MILPQMEQAALYNTINQNLTILGRENRTAHPTAISAFACPSDSASGRVRDAEAKVLTDLGLADPGARIPMVFTSYSASFGSHYVQALPRPEGACRVPGRVSAQADGAFVDLTSTRLSDIRDGLSQTLFAAEKACTLFQGFDAIDPSLSSKRGWWITGNWGDTLMTAMYPPNMIDKVAIAAGDAHTYAAGSLHPGGVNVLFGDGSVRFIKDTIQSWPFDPITGIPRGARRNPGGWWENLPRPGIWQALATRSGGEVVDTGGF
jgi:prepilin-type processing-associated H-X9-DG protein